MKNGSELQRFHKRFGKRAHERAVKFGNPLPQFQTSDVNLEHYQQQQREKQQEQQKQQQPQRHTNEAPPRIAIALPPIQPQLYPPPGPREDWSEQQASEWQWQQYCCHMQQTFLERDQEFQNQHPQWQQFYRQYQLQYWHRQQAQYYAALTLPDPADLFNLLAPPEYLVAASDPVAATAGHTVASPNPIADPAASLAPPTTLQAARPSLKRSCSPSPPRGRPEPPLHRSRSPLVHSLASGRLSPGHRNDHARPLAPPLQPRDTVVRPPSSLVAPTSRSEPLTSPATAVPGLPHGLPLPQSRFPSNDVVWPVLTEAEFGKMISAQQQSQQQQQVGRTEDVHKCE
jgi:hypothetical protein